MGTNSDRNVDLYSEAAKTFMYKDEAVNHPKHYNGHASGVECIDIIQHMNFCLGNAIKYIWRADLKGEAVEDLEKAIFYLKQEIERRNGQGKEKRSREAISSEPATCTFANVSAKQLETNIKEGRVSYTQHNV